MESLVSLFSLITQDFPVWWKLKNLPLYPSMASNHLFPINHNISVVKSFINWFILPSSLWIWVTWYKSVNTRIDFLQIAHEERRPQVFSRKPPGRSPAIRTIDEIQYIWSAIDQDPLSHVAGTLILKLVTLSRLRIYDRDFNYRYRDCSISIMQGFTNS